MAESGQRIGEAVAMATAALQNAGVDSPRLDAEVLLAHCLGRDRAYLPAHPHQPLTEAHEAEFTRLLARRLDREPLAYLTGRRWFYGLEFAVTPAVLIPRPETEMLVEMALAWLGDRQAPGTRIIDVGTGSGAIAIAVAANAPSEIQIYASDQSLAALDVAGGNARKLATDKAIHFLHGDLLSVLSEPVDLILANLPYVAPSQRPQLMPEVRDFEPAQALFSGADGLAHITRLLAQAPDYLNPGGAILLEIGYDQGEAAAALAQRHFPQAIVSVRPDLAGLDRLLLIQTSADPQPSSRPDIP